MISVCLKSTVRPDHRSGCRRQNLQQHVKHIVALFSTSSNKTTLIWTPANRFGQHTTFIITSIFPEIAPIRRDAMFS
jgi:hypothetical protein